jgi:hypothetical protein
MEVGDLRVARHRGAQGLQAATHHQLVLRVDERLRGRGNGHPVGDELFQQLGGHVLVIEGERVGAVSGAPQSVEIGVRADHDIRSDLRGRFVRCVGKHAQVLAKRDRRLVCHPGQLPGADHRNQWRLACGSGHSNHGVMARAAVGQ